MVARSHSNTSKRASGSKRRQGRRRAKARPRVSRALGWTVLGLALLVITGIGLLAWTRTQVGQATLLRLGSGKMYADVQAGIDAALVGALPGYHCGPAGRVKLSAADGGDDLLASDWPLPWVAPAAAVRCRVVPVPPGESFWQAQQRISEVIAPAAGKVLWGERVPRGGGDGSAVRSAGGNESGELLRLDLGVTGRPTHTLILYPGDTARPPVRWGDASSATLWDLLRAQETEATVALLIDDWGHFENQITEQFLALPAPLTLAILPGQPFSRRFALAATPLALPPPAQPTATIDSDRGSPRLRLSAGCPVVWRLAGGQARLLEQRREVMLHLPMEPENYPAADPGARAVMVGMSQQQIEELVDRAVASLPTVGGVNNHMGSRATADPTTMQAVMTVLRQRNLFFVDSMTTNQSVAYQAAVQAGVPALRSRLIIDADEKDPQQIRRNLATLVKSARSSGFAIGIGHPYATTMEVLRSEIPRLRAAGVHFVTVSELLALRRAKNDLP